MSTWINRLSKTELETQLEAYGIDSSGNTETLRGRLRQFVTKNPNVFGRTASMPKTDSNEPLAGRAEPLEPKAPATVLNQIRKWNLHFDGKDPFAFLERLDELRQAYGYTDDYLLCGLPELLRGDSLLWYRINREAWGTWGDFCQAFRTQYLPPGYQRALRREIDGRRQLPGETFDKYAMTVLTMMRRAGGYTKQDQLEQLYENMNPDYQLYIRSNEATSIAGEWLIGAQYNWTRCNCPPCY
ncbi:hypothetical protein CAJAP_01752 [Camponotus japonicus]